uniref:BZIP domain-containing protein n=1 Tax=Parastrongyloides trichosuri TaxID=131310 RepID=A0A0N4ZVN5_PARTI
MKLIYFISLLSFLILEFSPSQAFSFDRALKAAIFGEDSIDIIKRSVNDSQVGTEGSNKERKNRKNKHIEGNEILDVDKNKGKKLKELRDKVKDLKTENKRLKTENKELREKLKKLEKERKDLDNLKQKLNERKEKLKEKRQKLDEGRKKLKSDKEKFKNDKQKGVKNNKTEQKPKGKR